MFPQNIKGMTCLSNVLTFITSELLLSMNHHAIKQFKPPFKKINCLLIF